MFWLRSTRIIRRRKPLSSCSRADNSRLKLSGAMQGAFHFPKLMFIWSIRASHNHVTALHEQQFWGNITYHPRQSNRLCTVAWVALLFFDYRSHSMQPSHVLTQRSLHSSQLPSTLYALHACLSTLQRLGFFSSISILIRPACVRHAIQMLCPMLPNWLRQNFRRPHDNLQHWQIHAQIPLWSVITCWMDQTNRQKRLRPY